MESPRRSLSPPPSMYSENGIFFAILNIDIDPSDAKQICHFPNTPIYIKEKGGVCPPFSLRISYPLKLCRFGKVPQSFIQPQRHIEPSLSIFLYRVQIYSPTCPQGQLGAQFGDTLPNKIAPGTRS